MNTPEIAGTPQPTCYLKMRTGAVRPARADGFVADWAALRRGERVQVYRDAEMLTAGTVDATMPDGTGVWLIQDKGLGRRIYHRFEGLRIAKPRYPNSRPDAPAR